MIKLFLAFFCYTLAVNLSIAQTPKELYGFAQKATKEGNFLQAEKYLLSILKKQKNIKKRNIAIVYNQLGLVNKHLGRYQKAINFYYYAERICIKNLKSSKDLLILLYHNIGTIFMRTGDYNKALEYFEESLSILYAQELNEKRKRMAEATTINNIGLTHYKLKDFQTAIVYFKKRMLLGAKYELEDQDVSYHNYANCLRELNKYELSEKYYLKCINTRLEKFGEMYYRLPEVYLSFGRLELRKGDKRKALKLYEKALKIYKINYGEKHPDIAELLNIMGDYFAKLKKYQTAIKYYQESLIANSVSFNDSLFNSNPNLKDILSNKQLLKSLKNKSTILLEFVKQTKNYKNQIEVLKHCRETCEQSFQLVHKMRSSFSYEASQLSLSKDLKSIFETVAQAIIKLEKIDSSYKKEKIFEYLEKSKSATLGASLNDLNVKSFLSISDSLLEEEKELAGNRRYLETEIQKSKAKRDGYDTLLIHGFQKRLFKYSRRYDSLVNKIKTDYPKYYKLKHEQKVATITGIQEKIDKKSALINYFVGDSLLYIYGVTKNEAVFKTVKIDSSINNKILDYHIDIKAGFNQEELESSRELYQYLIEPIEEIIKGKNNLYIIPDEILYYLPFETLCQQNSNTNDLLKPDYLIKKYSIAYHYSATLWLNSIEKTENQTFKNDNFIGFAPVFDSKTNNGFILSREWISDITSTEIATRAISSDFKYFNALPYSEEEIKSIVNLYNKKGKEAKGYIYREANEEKFKQNVSKYKYVHIASHSFVNDQYTSLSGIAFSQPDTSQLNKETEDGILYAGETYNLELPNADLIVLSSCNSGIGKLVKGEGFLSLSRGFIYSGTPNIVFSLWNVKDEQTKDLMIEFYKHILKKKNYAHSLRKAKLKLINNPKTAQPKYWAAWVLVGK